jgi:hypothetical protein
VATEVVSTALGRCASGALRLMTCVTRSVTRWMGAEQPTTVQNGGWACSSAATITRGECGVCMRSVKIPRFSISDFPLALWTSGARQSGATKRERGLSAPPRKLWAQQASEAARFPL